MKKLNILFMMGLGMMYLYNCRPPEVGYLSDYIRALEDTIKVPRGIFTRSAPPEPENSTYPLKWKILRVKDADGVETNALFDPYEILTWKEAFNGDTDTTLELAKQKLELSSEPSLLINEVSGELAFTQASRFVDNDIFHVDVEVSNVRGTKQFEDFVVVELEKFKPVEFPVQMRSRILFLRGDGTDKIGYTSAIDNDFDGEVPQVLDGTHPYITIQKIDDEPKQGVRTKMIITDSYDNAISPEDIIFFPSNGTYLQNYHDNSVETTTDETATYFNLPAPPFPQYSRSYSGTSSYLMYYLTKDNIFEIDTAAYESEFGEQDWTEFQDPDTGEIMNRAYIRWGIKINDSGTYEMKMRIPYTKLKQ